MRLNYIQKIQKSLKRYKTIHTNRATSRLLDGSYRSIYKGRSMNFDELREYVVGDDVKDIDWKASARSQKLLIRQYIAEKKHNVMLILDTNRRMLANANEEQEKKEVALMSAGTLAYLVSGNGDYVSATYATRESVQHYPFQTGLMNVENILAHYDRDVTMENHSDINTPLEYVIHHFRRRMILIIVTDIEGIRRISETTLKRLLIMHDVLVINISDATSAGQAVFDMDRNEYLPAFFTRDKKLARMERACRMEVNRQAAEKLKRLGIASSTIDHTEELDVKIIELLNKHKIEKR